MEALSLDPSETPTGADLATRVNALVSEAERREEEAADGLDHERRQALREDVGRLQDYLEHELDRTGIHGLAVFSCAASGTWRAFRLAEPVRDRVEIARGFVLSPLVPVLERSRAALFAVVGREQGRLYRARAGRIEEIADHDEEQPRRHDQGGWSQARFQRSIDEDAAAHIRDVAELVERALTRLPDAVLVVAAGDEARATMEDALGPESRAALAGWISVDARAAPDEAWAEAAPVVAAARHAAEQSLLARYREEAGRARRAAGGWDEVLAAAPDARVDILLYAEDGERDAWECTRCGRPSATAGTCPLDGAPLERLPGAALELALRETLVHGGTARVLEGDADLPEQVGALLRF